MIGVEIRMTSGQIVTVPEFGTRDPAALTAEEKAFIDTTNAHIGDVDGGWFFARTDDGDMIAILARNVETITPL